MNKSFDEMDHQAGLILDEGEITLMNSVNTLLEIAAHIRRLRLRCDNNVMTFGHMGDITDRLIEVQDELTDFIDTWGQVED